MKKNASLIKKITKTKTSSVDEFAQRAKRGISAFIKSMLGDEKSQENIIRRIADGTAAQGIGQIGLSVYNPSNEACKSGCAFCCILKGNDGGIISEVETTQIFYSLTKLQNEPDGRDWNPSACAALDPETLTCRSYETRPMICRSYISTDASACEKVSQGESGSGMGTLEPYHTYLASLEVSRSSLKGVKRVSTYSLAKLAANTVGGATLDEALKRSRHNSVELNKEIKRSKNDIKRVS